MNMPDKSTYDVIILGSGLAGLYAALCLSGSESGNPLSAGSPLTVLMLSMQAPDVSGSSLAQGGVAAVLELADDSFALHREDTLAAGNYINDVEAVETLVREGPEDVRRVMALGVEFDRTPGGGLAKTLEGGHSRRRIVHHADQTGKEMVDKLLPRVLSLPGVTLLEGVTACAARRLEPGFAVDTLAGAEKTRFPCRDLLRATGGVGQVYRSTTNPAVSTGDGIRLAYELGARIKNLSLVQFHPTGFRDQGQGTGGGEPCFLVSEAVRGEGAYLLNRDHERFMRNYDPRLELAPRDVVSRAIIQEARRLGDDRFYLDIRRRGREFLRERFPGIYAACLERGVAMAEDLIPVFPCQHYLMGGVDVDLRSRTSVPGLYAAGECAHTGLHGGNRLASNSLPEALVFSRRAAQDILRNQEAGYRGQDLRLPPAPPLPPAPCPLPPDLRRQIQQTMQEACFVFPDPEKLPQAALRMRALYERLRDGSCEITRETAELRSLACVAMLILEELRGTGKETKEEGICSPGTLPTT
jgi:L-aspartate oxidase